MNKFASVVGALTLGSMAALTALPAQAQNVTLSFGQKYQVVETYCDRYPSDPDCDSFYRGSWRDRDYQRFYSTRRAPIDNIASGLFGFTFGAALGSIIANSNANARSGDVVVSNSRSYDAHVQACYNRYRSYDEETNTFMGYDGVRRQCQL
ncbi:BA14K family protein [Devosia soli]|uniref:BA14K family protein n=1 Tax=Devosia soli TaxID=361041 RepID=UPI00069A9A08|nr:BA14K family protein [Devosia soli]